MENRLILVSLASSIVAHGYFLLHRESKEPILNTKAVKTERAIETELALIETIQDKQVIDESHQSNRQVDTSRGLPQLPMAFTVKQTSPQEFELDPKKRGLPGNPLGKKKAKNPKKPSPASEGPRLNRKKNGVTELTKKDFIERLKIEQQRRKKKDKDKKKNLARKKKRQNVLALKEKVKQIDALLTSRKREIAVNSGQGHDYDSYQKSIQRILKVNYTLPKIYGDSALDTLVVQLIINKGGEIKELRLLQSSGNDSFDEFVYDLVKRSAPFPLPPEGMAGKPLQLNFFPQSKPVRI